MQVKLYKGEVDIEFKESSHRYKANGVAMPGVSSVLGVLSKDLMDWAVFMAVGSFTEAIKSFATSERSMTAIAFKNVVENAKKAHKNKSQHGKDVGTIVHAIIAQAAELALKDGKPLGEVPIEVNLNIEEPETSKQVKNCLEAWHKWCTDNAIEVIASERIVHSRVLGYCGTFDILYKNGRTGKIYMGDYKTSEPQKKRDKFFRIIGYKPYPEHFVQTAGYDYAYHEETGFDPDGYTIIYLPKEGEYQQFSREQVLGDRQGWEHLFNVFNWLKEVRRG